MMPWTSEELKPLRDMSVSHLLREKCITENQLCDPTLFTCDLCDKVKDCEWAYHHDNLKGHCLWLEVNEENQSD